MSLGLDVTSLDFDPVTPESAQFSVAIPDTWDLGDISFEIHWTHGAGATAFGVVWKIFACFLKDGDSILGALSNVSVADEGGEADQLHVADRATLTPAGDRALGGQVGIIIQRDTTNAADTLDIDAKLLGVRMFFGANRGNENTQQVFPPLPAPLDAETIVWRDLAIFYGGTFLPDSIAIADALIVAIKVASFNAKILYMLPFLGGNLATARVPLRRWGGLGGTGAEIAANVNYLEADFSQATGLQSNGTTKRLTTGITPAMLRPGTDFGGMGFWERNQVADGQNACGARGTQLWRIYYDTSTPRTLFSWPTGNPPQVNVSGNNHIYLQSKNAALATGHINGALVATQLTNTGTTTGSPEFNVGAVDGSFLGNVRAGVFYLTDGNMTDPEVAAFHTLLSTYLIAATGR